MEECETALQDPVFQRFLYSIGIKPPSNEQVRLPSASINKSEASTCQQRVCPLTGTVLEDISRVDCRKPEADRRRPKT